MAKLERSWNSFVRSMIQTKDAWERICIHLAERPNLDHLNPKAQKFMKLPFSKSPFFKAMPEFLRMYGNSRSDLRELLVSESSKDQPKQDHTVEKEQK